MPHGNPSRVAGRIVRTTLLAHEKKPPRGGYSIRSIDEVLRFSFHPLVTFRDVYDAVEALMPVMDDFRRERSKRRRGKDWSVQTGTDVALRNDRDGIERGAARFRKNMFFSRRGWDGHQILIERMPRFFADNLGEQRVDRITTAWRNVRTTLASSGPLRLTPILRACLQIA